jgi:hypothetical protein
LLVRSILLTQTTIIFEAGNWQTAEVTAKG